MRPSIARNTEQVNPRCSTTDIPLPQTAILGLHPVACPAEGRRLSWPEHTVGQQLAQGCLQNANDLAEIRTRDVKVTSPILHH